MILSPNCSIYGFGLCWRGAILMMLLLFFHPIRAFNFGAHPHEHDQQHKPPPSSTEPTCLRCPVGTGVAALCNATHQTSCRPCETGRTFSPSYPHVNRCQPCSLCGTGLFIERTCNASADTMCDSCQTSHTEATHTWEYFRACLSHVGNNVAPLTPQDILLPDQILQPSDLTSEAWRRDKIDFQLLQEESELRQEVKDLKTIVQDEIVSLKELGSAMNHMVEAQPRVIYHTTEKTTEETILMNGPYEKYPKMVLVIVLLSTFALLGVASLLGITIILCLGRRKSKCETYAGVRTSLDGASLLHVENNSDSNLEEDASI